MEDRSDFNLQREKMVERYIRLGYLSSPRMIEAMRRVPRELFMPESLRRYSYIDEPYPIPGNGRQTISAPYTYPLFYEPLNLCIGDKFLEIGMGSGYGAALARELVGDKGLVVTIEINKDTYEFGAENLNKAGYLDVIAVLGDGSKGYPECAPYNKICITAASPRIPPPLLEQLDKPGRLIAPIGPLSSLIGQDLTLIIRDNLGNEKVEKLTKVVYVPLQGEYGWKP
ncbi:MAG: protein-L-isoaspartate O-methyltransferase [Candidatus Bathyarchaeia archaeon]